MEQDKNIKGLAGRKIQEKKPISKKKQIQRIQKRISKLKELN